MDKNNIEILWTGGFDSTHRLCELSLHNVSIQPYYILEHRLSKQFELKSINNIINLLRSKKNIRGSIFNPIFISNFRDIKTNIHKEFDQLSKDYTIGTQYEYLATFAISHPTLELCIHKKDHLTTFLLNHGDFTLYKNKDITTYKFISRHSKKVSSIFENFSFPLIKKSKQEMYLHYIEYNFEDIMNLTWFCQTPIDGLPCGCCNSCKDAIDAGFDWRFSKEALKRHNLIFGKS